MKIISLNTGKIKDIEFRGNTYATGIYKYGVQGPLFLGKDGFETDEVVDKKNHGGLDMAVYAYGFNHYAYWAELFPTLNQSYGLLGENLTLSNLNESKIFIGDVFQLGETVIQVTKPRQPCFKLGIRFNDQNVVKQFWETTKSGVYFRILETGDIAKDDEFILIEKSKNSPSIADVFRSKRT